MKRVLICILVLVIAFSTIAFADSDNISENESNISENGSSISEKDIEKLSQELVKYQKKVQRKELSKTEVMSIATKLNLGHLEIYTEEEIKSIEEKKIVPYNNTMNMRAPDIDIDICKYYADEVLNSGSVYTIGVGIRNMDESDIHDSYTGTINGYTEIAVGTGSYWNSVTHIYQEFNVHPGQLPVDFISVGKPGSAGKAFFYVHLQALDDGVLMMAPYFKKWESWR